MAGEATTKLRPDAAAEWMKDKVRFKFFNHETEQDLTFSVNGEVFFLKHNSINVAPRGVVEALNDAKKTIWTLNDENMNKEPVKHEEPRMLAILVDEDTEKRLSKTKKDKAIDEILGEQQAGRKTEEKGEE